jgi:hypothetical protein
MRVSGLRFLLVPMHQPPRLRQPEFVGMLLSACIGAHLRSIRSVPHFTETVIPACDVAFPT